MREIRLYGSEGGGMSNHLSLPLSGQSLRARKAGLRGLWHTPSPPATLTLGRKDIKEFVGATRGRPNSQ